MENKNPAEDLFDDFNPLDKNDWINAINNAEKGAQYEDLKWSLREGLKLDPFYTNDDLLKIPNARSFNESIVKRYSSAHSPAAWINYQKIEVRNAKLENKSAINALNNGAEGIIFSLPDNFDLNTLQVLLSGILPQHCFISFESNQPVQVLKYYLQFLDQNQIEKNEVRGFIQFDPLANYMTTGNLDNHCWEELKQLLIFGKSIPNFSSLFINAAIYLESGGDAVQQVAFLLNQLTELVHQLTDNGANIEEITRSICFKLSVGTEFFTEIAKFRILPLLIARVFSAFGNESNFNPKIHVATAQWCHSRCDVDSNMIRNTTQALAAIIGGCTSIDIQPHVDENNDYKGAEAIARNISNIIKEESYLDKVSNPGAGSYFIESLSFQMADAIWNLFQETEKSGGLINALKGNLIQDQIIESREKQWENLQNECTTMVGVNKYKIENNQHKKFAEIENSNNDFRILREYRLSDPFEIIKSEKGGNDEA